MRGAEEDGGLMAGRRSGSKKGAINKGTRGERVEPSKPNHDVPASFPPTVEVGHSTIPSAEASPPQAMNPLWKTRLCNFFDSKSGCRHGRLCTFAHGAEELREAPDFTRTSICPNSCVRADVGRLPTVSTHIVDRSFGQCLGC